MNTVTMEFKECDMTDKQIDFIIEAKDTGIGIVNGQEYRVTSIEEAAYSGGFIDFDIFSGLPKTFITIKLAQIIKQ